MVTFTDQEEEAVWTDYSQDEVVVKEQLSSALLELLLTDTVDTLAGIYRRRGEGQAAQDATFVLEPPDKSLGLTKDLESDELEP